MNRLTSSIVLENLCSQAAAHTLQRHGRSSHWVVIVFKRFEVRNGSLPDRRKVLERDASARAPKPLGREEDGPLGIVVACILEVIEHNVGELKQRSVLTRRRYSGVSMRSSWALPTIRTFCRRSTPFPLGR
jgi:hypothetical protein